MNMRALRAYRGLQTESEVDRANPTQLVALVYRRIDEHLAGALRSLDADDRAAFGAAVDRAMTLVTEGLVASLDTARGGVIAANLSQLYDWAVRELLRARLRRDASMVEEVRRLLADLGAAWSAIGGDAGPG